MKKITLFIFLITFLAACGGKTGQKALQKGDYQQAVLEAVKKLKSSPDNEKASLTLREALPLAVAKHEEDISFYEKSSEKFHWEKVVTAYKSLNELHEAIRSSPAADKLVSRPKRYGRQFEDALENAAIERYEEGAKKLDPNDRMASREAFDHFERAQSFLPNYKDVGEKVKQARYYATLRVAVEPIPVAARNYQLSTEFFQTKLYEYLNNNDNRSRLNPFVQFYQISQLESQNIRPDHLLKMSFDEFTVGQTYIKSEMREVESKDSVKVGEATVDGKKIPVYNKVKAKITDYKKRVLSRGTLDVQIIDLEQNKIVSQEKFSGEYNWLSEWATYNGDERAVSDSDKKLCERKEQNPPPPQDLFIEFCKPIYDQTTDMIRRFYRNY